MIIAIDISMLVYAGSGVARYTFDLSTALLQYHPENTYKLFYSSRRRPPETVKMLELLRSLGAKVYDYHFPPWILKFWWNKHCVMPISWFIGKYDVFHSSDFLRPPLLHHSLGLTTIHDLTWKLFPELHEATTCAAHTRKLARTIHAKDLIITDSENTKTDLLKSFSAVDRSLVTVIPLAISDRFHSESSETSTAALRKYEVPNQPYILYVGAIEPRKRLDLCVQVFAELILDLQYENFNFIIAGRAGWKNEQLFSLIKSKKLENRVRFIGYVSDEDLPSIYSGASASLYLSAYEGFGLPPLESLACGTPVLASNTSSIREFVPEQYRVDSTDPVELAAKLKIIMHLPVSAVAKRISPFTWKDYCNSFLELLHRTAQ